MPAEFCFVHADFDGAGPRWRLAIDIGKYFRLADDETLTFRKFALKKSRGEKIIGPFTVDELLAGVRPETLRL
jgi:hypothetical protein